MLYFFRPNRNTRLELSRLPPFILVMSLFLTGPRLTTTDSVTNSLRFLDSIPRSVSPAVFSEAEREAQGTERAVGKYAEEGGREKRRENLQGTVTVTV